MSTAAAAAATQLHPLVTAVTDEELHHHGAGGGGVAGSVAGADSEHTLLGALKCRHKDRPAILTMSLIRSENEADAAAASSPAAADMAALPVLSVSLWRAEGLTSLVEVDAKLGILRAEPSTGLVFGVSHTALLHKSFRR